MVYDVAMILFNLWMYWMMYKLNKIPPVSSTAMIWFSLFYSVWVVFWIGYLIYDIHRWRIWI